MLSGQQFVLIKKERKDSLALSFQAQRLAHLSPAKSEHLKRRVFVTVQQQNRQDMRTVTCNAFESFFVLLPSKFEHLANSKKKYISHQSGPFYALLHTHTLLSTIEHMKVC